MRCHLILILLMMKLRHREVSLLPKTHVKSGPDPFVLLQHPQPSTAGWCVLPDLSPSHVTKSETKQCLLVPWTKGSLSSATVTPWWPEWVSFSFLKPPVIIKVLDQLSTLVEWGTTRGTRDVLPGLPSSYKGMPVAGPLASNYLLTIVIK